MIVPLILLGAFFVLGLYKLSRRRKQRFTNVCSVCQENHSFRTCSKFRAGIQYISEKMYMEKELDHVDKNYFFAAGVIPWCKEGEDIKIALLLEERQGKFAYNYIGGKRECLHEGDKYRLETPIETMTAEFAEEIQPYLSSQEFHILETEIDYACKWNKYKVIWYPQAKAVVYLINVPNDCQYYTYLNKLVWFSLKDFDIGRLHEFSQPVIEMIKANNLET